MPPPAACQLKSLSAELGGQRTGGLPPGGPSTQPAAVKPCAYGYWALLDRLSPRRPAQLMTCLALSLLLWSRASKNMDEYIVRHSLWHVGSAAGLTWLADLYGRDRLWEPVWEPILALLAHALEQATAAGAAAAAADHR